MSMTGKVETKRLSTKPLTGLWSPTHSILARALNHIDVGRLTIELPNGEHIEHKGTQPGPDAIVRLHQWRALRQLALGGDVGFAKAYIDGLWTTPDITALVELVARNNQSLLDSIAGHRLTRAVNWLRHRFNANTKQGSKKNIEYHYDLGNDFYGLWLDPRTIYSSALYKSPNETLEQAQTNKLDRIAQNLKLEAKHSVLEIGCGWGALAIDMAQNHGAHVYGVTLSPAQLEVAQERVQDNGIAACVDLRLQDYRDITGTFDRIVSIEMIEAVGEKFWPSYFGTLKSRLAENGRIVIQAITIADDRFETYRERPDFIQRFIFPGGCLPTKTAMREQAERAGLKLVSDESFGQSYAQTLQEWNRRFQAAWPQIEAQGFDDQFHRMWEYYLCYCEAGFKAEAIDVGLYTYEHA